MLFILGISLGAYGQKNCKPYLNYDDSFSGVHYDFYGGKIDYKKQMMKGVSTYVTVHMYRSEDVNYITARIDIYQGNNDASVNNIQMGDSSSFSIRTGQGIMDFKPIAVHANKKKMGEKVLTITEIHAVITDEQVSVLANNPILTYRISPQDYPTIQGEVAEKKSEKAQAQYACYAKSIGLK